MAVDVSSARSFVYGEGRLLERLLYARLFEDGDPGAVARAVFAYQNGDGGFGHGLEPDKRCPASQPLDVEIALERLVAAGVPAEASWSDPARQACDFLASIADPTGAVPVLLPSIAGYPRAAHWSETDSYPAGLNPTASIAGYAQALSVEHPWVDRATSWCFSTLEGEGAPKEGHTLVCIARFLDHASDRGRAEAVATALAGTAAAGAVQAMPEPERYGVTPLDIAPTPRSLARAWFTEVQVDAHLDALEAQQQADGGWPIRWDPPSHASRCEWRAIRTLQALRVLDAYERL